MAQILILAHARADGETDVYHLTPLRRYHLGRGSQCEIRILDLKLSRQHAALEWVDGAWTLTDLSSTNGCLIDGRMVSGRVALAPGAVIEAGSSRLRVVAIVDDTTDPEAVLASLATPPPASDTAVPTAAASTPVEDDLAPLPVRRTDSDPLIPGPAPPSPAASPKPAEPTAASRDAGPSSPATAPAFTPHPLPALAPKDTVEASREAAPLEPAARREPERRRPAAVDAPAGAVRPVRIEPLPPVAAVESVPPSPGGPPSAALPAPATMPSVTPAAALASSAPPPPATVPAARPAAAPPPCGVRPIRIEPLPPAVVADPDPAAAPATPSPAPAPPPSAPATAGMAPGPAAPAARPPSPPPAPAAPDPTPSAPAVSLATAAKPAAPQPPPVQPGAEPAVERAYFLTLLGQRVGPLTKEQARELKARELRGELTAADLAAFLPPPAAAAAPSAAPSPPAAPATPGLYLTLLGQRVGPLTREQARELKARELRGELSPADLAPYLAR